MARRCAVVWRRHVADVAPSLSSRPCNAHQTSEPQRRFAGPPLTDNSKGLRETRNTDARSVCFRTMCRARISQEQRLSSAGYPPVTYESAVHPSASRVKGAIPRKQTLAEQFPWRNQAAILPVRTIGFLRCVRTSTRDSSRPFETNLLRRPKLPVPAFHRPFRLDVSRADCKTFRFFFFFQISHE